MKAIFETTLGTIECKLFPEIAPITVENFVGLAKGTKEWTNSITGEKKACKLYDGTIFHRCIPQFMIQGGDPLGRGTGGPGYEFGDECHPDTNSTAPENWPWPMQAPEPTAASSSSLRFRLLI